MPIHWQGFTLYPRDFAAQNPIIPEGRKWVNGVMRGVPNPNITPSPTASPTPTPTTEPTAEPTPTTEPTAGPTPSPTVPADGGDDETTTNPVTFGHPEVAPGATQTATAEGFTPGETVSAVLHSEPVDVGTFIADEEGVVSAQFIVPANTAPGEHRLVLTGQTSSIVAEGTFTVAAASPAAVIGALASTGTDANRWALSGILLLIAGAGLAGTSWYLRRNGLKAQVPQA